MVLYKDLQMRRYICVKKIARFFVAKCHIFTCQLNNFGHTEAAVFVTYKQLLVIKAALHQHYQWDQLVTNGG